MRKYSNTKSTKELGSIASFVALLKACGKEKILEKGSKAHTDIRKGGFLMENIYVGNALVNMYAKCGDFATAREVFDELPVRDAVCWTGLISGYILYEKAEEAILCYERMRSEGLPPDGVTFASILKACGSIGAVENGEQILFEIERQGLLEKDIVLGNSLVDMYATSGALLKAQIVFDELPVQDVVGWGALITGYTKYGQGEEALNCFGRFQCKGLLSDAVTFTSVLKACAITGMAEKGKEVHMKILTKGLLENDVVLGNALIDMYATCGSLENAQRVFDELPILDVTSWTALMAGYTHHGYSEEALRIFEKMQLKGLPPNGITFSCILNACGDIGAAGKAAEIHARIAREQLLGKDTVLSNALIDMYAKCGAFLKAQKVLGMLPVQNVTSYNALIAGYIHYGHGGEALKWYGFMQVKGVSPNAVTFACILKACGSIGDVEKGGEIHTEIDKWGLLDRDITLGNAVVDMYAKCGALAEAQQMFDKLPSQNLIAWTALTAGHIVYGHSHKALSCFMKMQQNGLLPDIVAFTCMVDLFGHSGDLDKAMNAALPSNDVGMWSALLAACQRWGNSTLGRLAFKHVIKLNEMSSQGHA